MALKPGQTGTKHIQAEIDSVVDAATAGAEAAQLAAETAETNAETAETNAETAETNAELAETNAEAAQAAAEAAEAGATAAAEEAAKPDPFTVATAPAAAANTGRIIYVSDGDAGNPCLAYSNGADWLVIALGIGIAIA